MGIGPFNSSKCRCDCHKVWYGNSDYIPPKKSGNPDPKNFKILEFYARGNLTAVKVQYPDATNYEGIKIMIFPATVIEIEEATFLDPHFCDSKEHISPFARFTPTPEGWIAAKAMTDLLAL